MVGRELSLQILFFIAIILVPFLKSLKAHPQQKESQILAFESFGYDPYLIIGGSDAAIGEFPWQVALRYSDETIGAFCGGAILNEKTIVTAAHCVQGLSSLDFVVIAGAHSVFDPDNTEQIVPVSSIRRHPTFNPETYDGDVALLSLGTSLAYNARVGPIEIPSTGTIPTGTCIAVGWGSIRHGEGSPEYPQVLQKVELEMVDRESCEEVMESVNPITAGMICGSAKNYKGTCYGDSGSGFICKSSGGSYYLAGVVSWGVRYPYCVYDPKYPSVFANMAHYAPWIQSDLGEAMSP